jgi:hypothetical protein
MTEFKKYDQDKLRYDLLPTKPLEEVVGVLTYGASKYDAENWHKCKSQRRYFAAAMRHAWAWFAGETNDPESGYHHLAHAVCCLLFLIALPDIRPESDDRPHLTPKEE